MPKKRTSKSVKGESPEMSDSMKDEDVEADEKETQRQARKDGKSDVNEEEDEDEDDRQFRELTDQLNNLKSESNVITKEMEEEEEEKRKAEEIQNMKDREAIKNRRRDIINRFRWYER